MIKTFMKAKIFTNIDFKEGRQSAVRIACILFCFSFFIVLFSYEINLMILSAQVLFFSYFFGTTIIFPVA